MKAYNIARKLVQRYGGAPLKRRLWDWEFRSGKWDVLQQFGSDPIYPLLSAYARGGAILDLGCGPGTTANELSPSAYSSYTGVDISAVALETARRRSELRGESRRHEYAQGDLISYVPTRSYRVILAGDSLYYLPPGQIVPTLTRYAGHLEPGGVLLVKLNGMPKHRPLMDRIAAAFTVIERTEYPPDVAVIACQPRNGAA
jgi:trans-aconitate methyltransferase